MSEFADKIAVGRLGKSYGILGWMHIHSYTDPPTNLLNYAIWQIKYRDRWQQLHLETGKKHGNGLIAKLAEIHAPELARTYTNCEIYINKNELPPLAEDEAYLEDLMGCKVINQTHQELGIVKEIMSTGANDVLVLLDKNNKRQLIPYIHSVIAEVNVTQKTIRVILD